MNVFCVTGASGFIGSHLVRSLASRPQTVVRTLSRGCSEGPRGQSRGTLAFEGDLRHVDSLKAFVAPGATVIHLAQFHDMPMMDQLSTTKNFAEVCLAAGISRFLYVSTATVVGRTDVADITEDTLCHPANEYEKQKFAIETLLREELSPQVDFGVLRPTAVFGAGGLNLIKLAQHIERGPQWSQYLRRLLYGRRSMNLVAYENVVAAIEFLASGKKRLDSNVFLISDDDEPLNNYVEVERILGRILVGMDFASKLALPSCILMMVLTLSGRSQTNPRIKYANGKLRGWGFERATQLEPALMRFAEWYKAQAKGEPKANAL
jgi:nucleoside-diphosphate-sugar epimerase